MDDPPDDCSANNGAGSLGDTPIDNVKGFESYDEKADRLLHEFRLKDRVHEEDVKQKSKVEEDPPSKKKSIVGPLGVVYFSGVFLVALGYGHLSGLDFNGWITLTLSTAALSVLFVGTYSAVCDRKPSGSSLLLILAVITSGYYCGSATNFLRDVGKTLGSWLIWHFS
ncbi:hypothetical protein [Amycolatopsis sp. WAC 01376]|uniref:hypothetical protein n=1 Tax=Amycolatopsis sp. WAC 01376 TaxID=2203195 RepID=UPI000F768F0F|nr:hypothetical protein [Amycolatopsis sp. WAC 01376]